MKVEVELQFSRHLKVELELFLDLDQHVEENMIAKSWSSSF